MTDTLHQSNLEDYKKYPLPDLSLENVLRALKPEKVEGCDFEDRKGKSFLSYVASTAGLFAPRRFYFAAYSASDCSLLGKPPAVPPIKPPPTFPIIMFEQIIDRTGVTTHPHSPGEVTWVTVDEDSALGWAQAIVSLIVLLRLQGVECESTLWKDDFEYLKRRGVTFGGPKPLVPTSVDWSIPVGSTDATITIEPLNTATGKRLSSRVNNQNRNIRVGRHSLDDFVSRLSD